MFLWDLLIKKALPVLASGEKAVHSSFHTSPEPVSQRRWCSGSRQGCCILHRRLFRHQACFSEVPENVARCHRTSAKIRRLNVDLNGVCISRHRQCQACLNKIRRLNVDLNGVCISRHRQCQACLNGRLMVFTCKLLNGHAWPSR
jgi:hypothetical protein